jgi:hypothetical protein
MLYDNSFIVYAIVRVSIGTDPAGELASAVLTLRDRCFEVRLL